MQSWAEYLADELPDSPAWRAEIDHLRAEAHRERRQLGRIADYPSPADLAADLESNTWVGRPGQHEHHRRYLLRLSHTSQRFAGATAIAPAAIHELACGPDGYRPSLPALEIDPGVPAGPAASAIHERLAGADGAFSRAAQRQAMHRHVRPLRAPATSPTVRTTEPFSFAR